MIFAYFYLRIIQKAFNAFTKGSLVWDFIHHYSIFNWNFRFLSLSLSAIQMRVDTARKIGCMEITATISKIAKWVTRTISIIIQIMATMRVAMVITASNHTNSGSSSNNNSIQTIVVIDSNHINNGPISRIRVASIAISHQTVVDTGANYADFILVFFFALQFPYIFHYIHKIFLLVKSQNYTKQNRKLKEIKTIQLNHTLNEWIVNLGVHQLNNWQNVIKICWKFQYAAIRMIFSVHIPWMIAKMLLDGKFFFFFW